MVERAIEAERRAPIVYVDERDVVVQAQRVEPGVEIAGVIGEAIGVRRRFARLAHADQVGRETASVAADIRNDVAPQIGRRGITVQEDDRVAFAGVHVTHFTIDYGDAPSRVRVGGVDCFALHRSSSLPRAWGAWRMN
jgi:hypothetical protein